MNRSRLLDRSSAPSAPKHFDDKTVRAGHSVGRYPGPSAGVPPPDSRQGGDTDSANRPRKSRRSSDRRPGRMDYLHPNCWCELSITAHDQSSLPTRRSLHPFSHGECKSCISNFDQRGGARIPLSRSGPETTGNSIVNYDRESTHTFLAFKKHCQGIHSHHETKETVTTHSTVKPRHNHWISRWDRR